MGETMTLGDLIDALRACRPEARVRFDLGDVVPTTLDSWRGIYAELALGYDLGDRGGVRPTVASLLRQCEAAVGDAFAGYKGGEYTMDRDTPVHVDRYGDCTDTHLDRVEARGEHDVVLRTWQGDDRG